MNVVLKIKHLSKHFGGLKIIDDISPIFLSNSVTAIIGPNGTGKTTLFNIISGYIHIDNPKSRIIFNNENIINKSPEYISSIGIGRLFQDLKIFKNLTVMENVICAMQNRKDERLISIFSKNSNKKKEYEKQAYSILKTVSLQETIHLEKTVPFLINKLPKSIIEKNEYILEKVGLIEKRYLKAGELSYGQQKLLAFARLIGGDFKLLLLDEPTAGINPKTIEKMLTLMKDMVKQGKTIIIVEHNMKTVKDIADWVHFLNNGKIAFSGTPDHVLGAKEVRRIYLGMVENNNEQ